MGKKIWIFSHYSADPRYNPGYRYYNWAKELIKRGYDIYIFCSSTIHNTDINVISDKATYVVQNYEGICYVYVRCSGYSGNGIKRIFNMLEFSKNLDRVYKEFDRPDVIIGRLPHVWCGEIAYKASKKFNVPLICDIADLWPEGFVEHLNISQSNPMVRYYNVLEHRMYKRADALIFSMAGGKQLIKDKKWTDIDLDKVFHINMGVDLDAFDYNKNHYKKTYTELERRDIFKITYCGSIRLINHVSTICEAARLLKNAGYNDIFISIHGYGDKEEELRAYCRKYKLDNIKFFGKIDKKEIPYVLCNSDVNVLSYHETPLYKYGGSMSKMFEAFAAGRPILSNVHMGYSLIEKYNCGVVSEKNTPEAIAKAIIELKKMNPEKLKELGLAARQCAELYNQPQLVDKLEIVINKVLSD